MDKVLSTRLDEKVIAELTRCSQKLGMTKKQFLEEAISLRAKEATVEERLRVVRETFGALKHDDETPDESLAKIRRSREEEWERRDAYYDNLSHRVEP